MAEPRVAIQGLPILTYKGLTAPPYDDLSFSFSHRQNEKKYTYIDGASHETTGRDPYQLPVKMYFLNTLQRNAFPDLWLEWWDVLRDGESGILEHPIVGEIDAVVMGGDLQITASVTSGIIVNVNFSETLKDPANASSGDAVSITLDPEEIITAVETAIEVFAPSQESVLTLEQLAGLVRGLLDYGNLTADFINKGTAWADEMIQLAKEGQSHLSYDTQDKLVLFYNALLDTSKKIGTAQRPTGSVLLNADTTLDKFAVDRGNTLQEIMTLNPAALATPLVLSGTMLKYYV